MIHDGPKSFPESCVKYVRFQDHELRYMFGALREKEESLNIDLKATDQEKREAFALIEREKNPALRKLFALGRLYEVEALLIWMVNNVTGTAAEVERRRRGEGKDSHLQELEDRQLLHPVLRLRKALMEAVS